tara:strand:+ start:1552 stop:2430 length:879 start_codon:yes stop_codon:yes gene_type:complete
MFNQIIIKIQFFLILGRYDKPYGSFLLMWPCFWGIIYSQRFNLESIKVYLLLFAGSFIMRGAGCTINDICDVKFDRQIQRTKNRPLARNLININEAVYFLLFQLLIGFLIVINFKLKIILLGFVIMPFVFSYPLFKRITFFPQLILGLVFNWGILIGALSFLENFDTGLMFLYLGGVLLTVGYDTIYAFQDLDDDKKIGIKSLAIRISSRPKLYLSLIYGLSYFLFLGSFISIGTEIFLSLTLSILVLIHLFFQIKNFNVNNSEILSRIFLSNTGLGALIFLILVILKYSSF